MEPEQLPSHWVEGLANKVITSKKPPYIISSGITTSGPTHLGTLCEALYPHALFTFISREHPAKFFFVADIMDAFDSVPSSLAQFTEQLTPHLGKPLAHVPDPLGCCPSFGDHFLNEAKQTMAVFGIKPEILKADELYNSGKYDPYARKFLLNQTQIGEIVRRTSLKPELPKTWSPIMPICQHCGRIATTTPTSYDEKTDTYTYICNKDVKYTKGCGFTGTNKISDHKYKITWRLDWPTRQDFLNTAAEGSGMDHMTRGGSWDTAKAVHEEFFKKEPPIPYKFGFILFKGKKYSKSKGIGMGVLELTELLPPEVIKYILLRPDLEENIDIDPNPQNLLRAIDDFASAAELGEKMESKTIDPTTLSRADRKRGLAASLSADSLHWKKPFSDFLLRYEIYGDWQKTGEALSDPGGAAYLSKYISKWLEKKFMPDEYLFTFSPIKPTDDVSKKFFSSLKETMAADEIHNLVFETAKEANIPPAELFKRIYLTLINKERGPRLGKFIEALGIQKVRSAVGA